MMLFAIFEVIAEVAAEVATTAATALESMATSTLATMSEFYAAAVETVPEETEAAIGEGLTTSTEETASSAILTDIYAVPSEAGATSISEGASGAGEEGATDILSQSARPSFDFIRSSFTEFTPRSLSDFFTSTSDTGAATAQEGASGASEGLTTSFWNNPLSSLRSLSALRTAFSDLASASAVETEQASASAVEAVSPSEVVDGSVAVSEALPAAPSELASTETGEALSENAQRLTLDEIIAALPDITTDLPSIAPQTLENGASSFYESALDPDEFASEGAGRFATGEIAPTIQGDLTGASDTTFQALDSGLESDEESFVLDSRSLYGDSQATQAAESLPYAGPQFTDSTDSLLYAGPVEFPAAEIPGQLENATATATGTSEISDDAAPVSRFAEELSEGALSRTLSMATREGSPSRLSLLRSPSEEALEGRAANPLRASLSRNSLDRISQENPLDRILQENPPVREVGNPAKPSENVDPAKAAGKSASDASKTGAQTASTGSILGKAGEALIMGGPFIYQIIDEQNQKKAQEEQIKVQLDEEDGQLFAQGIEQVMASATNT